MSKAIVRQSLDYFEDSAKETSVAEKNKSETQKKRKLQLNSHTFSKGLALEKKFSRQTIDQLRKKLSKQKDKTEENLKRLQALNRKPVSEDSSSLIFKRANRSRKESEIVKPVEGTVFTEEDFAMFEREYVVD